MAKMPQDALELVPYFKGVEQLFKHFEVEKGLRAHLLKPHLTEAARALIARMDPVSAADYDQVKIMLLREFKLSPASLLEKFNAMSRANDETYTLYANRLKSVLAYYIESRKATSYDLLVDLLICDRIKSNLTEGALRYVLSVENKEDGNWLRLAKLTESLNLFYDSHLMGDRPRYVSTAVSDVCATAKSGCSIPPSRPPLL